MLKNILSLTIKLLEAISLFYFKVFKFTDFIIPQFNFKNITQIPLINKNFLLVYLNRLAYVILSNYINRKWFTKSICCYFIRHLGSRVLTYETPFYYLLYQLIPPKRGEIYLSLIGEVQHQFYYSYCDTTCFDFYRVIDNIEMHKSIIIIL
jgi:hypothetical protein